MKTVCRISEMKFGGKFHRLKSKTLVFNHFTKMNLLPEEVIPSVLCYARCSGGETENYKVDVAFCNSFGYLFEVSNRKIVNSCSVPMNDAVTLLTYYKYKDSCCKTYYLLINKSGVLCVVKKYKNILLVAKSYENVKDCKIFDFEGKGYPQVGIYHSDSSEVSVTDFSEFDNVQLDLENYFLINEEGLTLEHVMKEKENNVSEIPMEEDEDIISMKKDDGTLTDLLFKKLKEIELFNNELNHELHNLNVILRSFGNESTYCDSAKNMSIMQFSQACKINISKIWRRICSPYWVLGIEFWSDNEWNVDDLEVIVAGEDFSSCIYKFFDVCEADKSAGQSTEESAGTSKIDPKGGEVTGSTGGTPVSTVDITENYLTDRENGNHDGDALSSQPRSQTIALVAVEIPEFGRKSQLTVILTLIYENKQLHRQTLHLKPEDLLDEKNQIFHSSDEASLSEDLLACLVTGIETILTVEVKYDDGKSLEDKLRESLGFQKARILGDDYFIKKNGYLGGTSVLVKQVWNGFLMWKLKVSVKSVVHLDVFIKTLESVLQGPVRIRRDSY